MKTRVIKDDFREIQIRPQQEFETYLKLLEKDVKEVFKGNAGKHFYYCPACTSENSEFKFSKHTFSYRECNDCSTVYMSPRPTRSMLHDLFLKSKAIRYWNSNVFQDSKQRKQHIFTPRLRWLNESIEFSENSAKRYCDYYSKYLPFIRNIDDELSFSEKISYKPVIDLENDLRENNFKIIDSFQGEKFAVITAFEVFDRFYNPRKVLSEIKENLEIGGMIFISTTSASGLDFQILQKYSPGLTPPIHLNVFSVEGILILLEELGFEILELSTPGSLDMDIINQHKHEVEIPKYISDILDNRGDDVKEAFQEVLQRARLSSHMRILAKNI